MHPITACGIETQFLKFGLQFVVACTLLPLAVLKRAAQCFGDELEDVACTLLPLAVLKRNSMADNFMSDPVACTLSREHLAISGA